MQPHLNNVLCPAPHQRRAVRFAAIFGVALCVTGCSVFTSPPMPRGAYISKADFEQLKPGVSTRADATDLLGTPTTRATFDDSTWIYISGMTRLVPMSFPAIKKQQVVVLNFDNAGVLQKMTVLGKNDAKPVTMASDITPTPGTKINFMQQILGNIGRYSPLSSMLGGNTIGGSNGMMGSDSGPGHGGLGNTLGGGM